MKSKKPENNKGIVLISILFFAVILILSVTLLLFH
jgi:hypothetical protein